MKIISCDCCGRTAPADNEQKYCRNCVKENRKPTYINSFIGLGLFLLFIVTIIVITFIGVAELNNLLTMFGQKQLL